MGADKAAWARDEDTRSHFWTRVEIDLGDCEGMTGGLFGGLWKEKSEINVDERRRSGEMLVTLLRIGVACWGNHNSCGIRAEAHLTASST